VRLLPGKRPLHACPINGCIDALCCTAVVVPASAGASLACHARLGVYTMLPLCRGACMKIQVDEYPQGHVLVLRPPAPPCGFTWQWGSSVALQSVAVMSTGRARV
jgi:hypothetical protein